MDDAAALAAAQAFGDPAGPLRPVGAGPSPLFDVTFADGRRVALRLHGDTPPQVVGARIRLAEALADAGLAAPWPQRTRAGGLTHAGGDVTATALQWVAARPVGLAPSGPARGKTLHDLGALVADLHLTADVVAPAGLVLPDLRPPMPARIHAPDGPASDRDLLNGVLARARSDLVGAPTGIVLGGGSVLNGDDGLWLIGLDRFAGTGWRAMDLADMLWPHAAAPDLPELRDALLAGYVTGGGAAGRAGQIAVCLALRAILALDPVGPVGPVGPDGAADLARAVALARAVPPAG